MKMKNYIVLRRILAWIMLLFFILLLVNIMIFRLYLAESAIAYGIMVALFLFMRGFGRGGTNYEAEEDGGEEDIGSEGNSETRDQQD